MKKKTELKGKKFGDLTVIEYLGSSYWLCACECGEKVKVRADSLVGGMKQNCGCKSSRKLKLEGQKFGKLTVINLDHTTKRGTFWRCKCDCGNEKVIKGTSLVSKTRPTKSCGCIVKEKSPANLPKHKCITHNMTGTKFYGVWNSMIMRCHNPNSKSYPRYGANGITVCNEWREFKNFYEDMYSAYSDGVSIDRIDNTKGYSKENCRWVDMKVQCNNRSSNHQLTYKGKTYTLAEASEKFDIPYHTLKRRIYKGWDIEKSLTTKVRKEK